LRRWRAIAYATASSSARTSDCVADKPEWIPSSHPLPDARSVAAGRRAIGSRTDSDDTLIVLLSGGASALMAVPPAR
jgi:glycerate-2-kinase